MRRIILMLWMVVVTSLVARAQKSCVIASAEDHVPIREALIHTNNNHWARTDYRGYWTMKYQFDSAVVSKTGFLKTTIYLKNLPDTVFLLPETMQVGTVEVWGKNQKHIRDMEEQVRQNAASSPNANNGMSFDAFGWMDRRGNRDRKHLKTAKKVIGEMDRKDPIISAYEQAVGKSAELKPTESVRSSDKLSSKSKEQEMEEEEQKKLQAPKTAENGEQNAEKQQNSTK